MMIWVARCFHRPRRIDVIGTTPGNSTLCLPAYSFRCLSDRGSAATQLIGFLHQENGQQEVKRHMPATEMSMNGSFLVDMSSSFLLLFHLDGAFPSSDRR
jgi:hypothetical protein